MLKYGEPNPLSVFGLRRIEHCPPHFISIFFSIYTQEKTITDWIYTNLTGRFYLNDHFEDTGTGSINLCKCAAFEIPGEASYFSLILNTINKTEFNF